MKKIIVCTVTALALVFGFSACAEGGESTSPEQVSNLDGGFKVGTVTINGKELTCVVMNRSSGNSAWGGMSCDWVAYHGLDESKDNQDEDF